MTVVLVSNFLNHHQIPFCEEMLKKCDDFYFVATDNGATQGYQKTCEKPYVVDYINDRELAEKIVVEADAVIFGSCPNNLIELRMNKNKLSFLYSERFFKRGIWRRFIPRTRRSINQRVVDYKEKNMLVLCASAFLPYDLSLLGFSVEKCLKWGYFPDCQLYAEQEEKMPNSIIWSARMLDWKHPEIPVLVAEKLKKDGYSFNLSIVGDGVELENTKKLAQEKSVIDCVHFLGSLPHEELLLQMRKHEIFLMTSDFYEGWGAVLNEAMSSRCVPVASHAIGSVPFLIKDDENGLVFRSGDVNDAYLKIKKLFDNREKITVMSDNAYSFMKDLYNYEIAADRLVEFLDNMMKKGDVVTYEEGPLSKATVITNNWYR